MGAIMLISLIVGLAYFLRRRRKLRLERDALRMSVVDPTPRTSMLSQAPSLFSWMRRSRTESVYTADTNAQMAAAKRAADPFGDEMKVVDLNEKVVHGARRENPFSNMHGLPAPSIGRGVRR